MVGSKGKGSRSRLRSKSEGLVLGPVESVETLKIRFDESSDDPLDGEDKKVDNLNSKVISLEEEQDEIISGSVVSDEHDEKDQNAHEVHDREKDVVTEMNVDRTEDVCLQEETIEDVNLMCEGNDAGGDVNVEDIEQRTNEMEPEDDQALMKFGLDNNDACTEHERKSSEVTTGGVPSNNEGVASSDHELMEFMIDNLENLNEQSKIDLEEPIGAVSEMGKENQAGIANEVIEQVNRPKRKAGKKKVVKKRIMVRKLVTDLARESDNKLEEDEEPIKVGLDNNDAGSGEERKISEVTSEVIPTNNEGLTSSDHGIMENKTDNLEDHNEPSKLDVDKASGILSDPGQEHIKENSSPTREVLEVTGQVNRPKRKVVRKKVVKKNMVKRPVAALNEEMPQPSHVNNASSKACKQDSNKHVTNADLLDEACKADKSEHVNDEEGAEVKPPVKVNRKRKLIRKRKVPRGDSGMETAKDSPKPQSEPRIQKHINEPSVKIGEVKNSGDRVSLLKSGNKKKVAKKGFQEGIPKDINEPKLSKEGKAKRIDSMGMIFMCSTETKKDCYRYKVLGLPSGKKDMVLKIYKGMRLFLFDVDLRMLYGVYKAAGPGGYNLEPRAFKSKFPSQVRFSILEDCVPLEEERFRKVLHANYYTKNKFNCQLNSVQVKNLCKLFHETKKKAESQGSQRPAASSSSARRDMKRERAEDRPGGAAPVKRDSSRQRAQKEIRRAPVVIGDRSRHRVWEEKYAPMVIDGRSWRRAPEEMSYAPMDIDDRSRRRAEEEMWHSHVIIDDRSRRRDQEELRHVPVVIDDRSQIRAQEEFRRTPLVIDDRSRRRDQEEIRHAPMVIDDSHHGLPVYERETYLSSVAPATSFQSLPALNPRSRMYSFDRAVGVDPYTGTQESRLSVGQSHIDSYVSYREPHVYSGSLYSTDTRRDHYDSSSDGRYAEYFRQAEHRPPPPLYRRY